MEPGKSARAKIRLCVFLLYEIDSFINGITLHFPKIESSDLMYPNFLNFVLKHNEGKVNALDCCEV